MLNVLSLCEVGTLRLVASSVHAIENARCPFPDRRAHAEDALALAEIYMPMEEGVVRRARSYEADGIKALDALHLAAAVEARADIFCTTDDALLNRGHAANTESTAVVSPLELILRLR
ncbi:MAG: PIN domain-containing protein [Bacteroidota bacterium]